MLPGRRNNPPDPKTGVPPLAVYNPIHYQELPELFMDFICSLTGKSPSTTGFGSEGALTKGAVQRAAAGDRRERRAGLGHPDRLRRLSPRRRDTSGRSIAWITTTACWFRSCGSARGHSIEFRINAEDPARNFLPAPGTITTWNLPSGPGVRVDAGYRGGMTVPQVFDSLIAKLIVTGASRAEALQRSARALAEFEVGGMPTVLPFHRAVVADPAFAGEPLRVHTRWIETEFAAPMPAQEAAEVAEPAERDKLTVEVGGKRLEVVVPAWIGVSRRTNTASAGAERARGASRSRRAVPAGSGDTLVSPMQGTIIKIAASEGQQVSAGDVVVVLEAMKMEQPLTAHKDGTVTGLSVEVGQTVSAGAAICELAD